MIYIGIDPGKKGGIALIDVREGGERIVTVYTYTDDTLKELCSRVCGTPTFCIVEKVSAMPRQGVTSTFHFGQSFGYILGVLEAHRIPYQLVTPKTWKRHFGLSDDKTRSIETAKHLFPNSSLLPTPKCRVESDGMAEALLMALYGLRLEKEK